MARLSMRDQDSAVGGREGEGEGEPGACMVSSGLEDAPRLGMLGIEDRMVRFEGS